MSKYATHTYSLLRRSTEVLRRYPPNPAVDRALKMSRCDGAAKALTKFLFMPLFGFNVGVKFD